MMQLIYYWLHLGRVLEHDVEGSSGPATPVGAMEHWHGHGGTG